jgi:hypothetical protein
MKRRSQGHAMWGHGEYPLFLVLKIKLAKDEGGGQLGPRFNEVDWLHKQLTFATGS